MAESIQQRFTKESDWIDFLGKINKEGSVQYNFYELRRQCYTRIETLRNRPLLVYTVKFPLPPIPQPIQYPISIDLEDIDGFTDLVESIESDSKKVDVLLHSPGGSAEATERIVGILRSRFDEVGFIIPHSAYSAATMLALSGDEIILQSNACLGPIDPQINGVPVRALKRGFDNAKKALKEEGPGALPAYVPLLEKYTLEQLEICDDYEILSKDLVTEWLSTYMYKGDKSKDISDKIDAAVKFFSNHDAFRTHARGLTFEKVKHLDLNIKLADAALRPLLREAYIQLDGFFNLAPFAKLYENNRGLSWGKQYQTVIQQMPFPQPLPPEQHPTKPIHEI